MNFLAVWMKSEGKLFYLIILILLFYLVIILHPKTRLSTDGVLAYIYPFLNRRPVVFAAEGSN